MVSRDDFHFAKLALFNTRLLDDIDRARQTAPEVAMLVSRRCLQDQISQPVSLLHQASVLQAGYICLVWLWELVKRANQVETIIQGVKQRMDIKACSQVNGEREVNSPSDHLRLIRNAISHARVSVEDEFFVFADIDPKKEQAETTLRLSWSDLDRLSEAMLFAVNDVVYPGGRSSAEPNGV